MQRLCLDSHTFETKVLHTPPKIPWEGDYLCVNGQSQSMVSQYLVSRVHNRILSGRQLSSGFGTAQTLASFLAKIKLNI
jgi:hypothetical protein